MASGDDRAVVRDLDASGLSFGIISARWNSEIVRRLAEGAERGFANYNVESVEHFTVPGAFELPFAAKQLALSGKVDGIVVVGAVIRGETTHYELVAGECGRGIMNVQLDTGMPIGMGVLTVEDLAQANARSEDAGGHNVGEEAATVAVELALLVRNF